MICLECCNTHIMPRLFSWFHLWFKYCLWEKNNPLWILGTSSLRLQVTPKFCKQFAQVGDVINKALLEYKKEVTNGSFPGPDHSPYRISAADVNGFLSKLQKMGLDKAASATAAVAEKMDKSESPNGENSSEKN